MVIYITTNLVNGKRYIGRDSNNNPHYYGSGTAIKKALKKYGKHNFKKEILEHCDNTEKLQEQEMHWIKKFNAVESDEFYNLDNNTYGSTKFNKPSPDSKSQKMKQYWSSMLPNERVKFSETMSNAQSKKGKKHSPQSKLMIVKNRKTFRVNNRKSKGLRVQSESTKLLRSKIMQDKSQSYSKLFMIKVDQYTLDDVYIKTWDSLSDIKTSLNLDIGSISNCINGKRQKTVGGFKWKKHSI